MTPSLHTLLRDRARLVPDAVAVTRAETSLTYRELARRADRLTRSLRGRAVPQGALIGLRLPAGPDLAVAILGVLGAGAAFTVLDPASASHGGIVLDSTGLTRATAAPPRGPRPAPPVTDPVRPVCAVTGPGRTAAFLPGEADLTCALLAERDALGLAPGDTVLHRTPSHETFGVVEILLTLLAGARLAVPEIPDDDDVTAALDTMTLHHTTHVRLPGTMLLDALTLSSMAAFHLLRAGFSHKAVWTTPDLDPGTRARVQARTRFPLRPVALDDAGHGDPAMAIHLARLLTPPEAPPAPAPPAPADTPSAPAQAVTRDDATPAVLRAVIRTWEEVLEHTGITAHDDFFALGGNSVTAVLATDAVSGRIGRDVPFDLLFQHRTLSAYAVALTTTHGADRGSHRPKPTEGDHA
ncbi:non-ribosomal peptide synthetase [Kitasatospora sp. NPDC101235]|uniref:non-ribosomal peptide synthetase n=1 Tax=Kitasatospora sp. NPDC101235 TaxID=3364101 RepID=UPI00381ECCB5